MGDNNPFTNLKIDPYGQSTPNFQDIQYDRDELPHILYSSGASIFHMTYAGLSGNCHQGFWRCDVAYANPSLSPLAGSFGLTYYGSPRLAVGTANGLQYISKISSGGNCLSEWRCDKIEEGIYVDSVVLLQPSCQVICSSPVQIAYVENNNGRLKLATSVQSGGNCGVDGQAGKWQCDIIETVGTTLEDNLAMTRFNGLPYIAYTDSDDQANKVLKIAYPASGGNCGPTLNGAGTWQCDTIDDGLRMVGGSPFLHNVGLYPSLAINSAGVMYIAYYDSADGDLLLAEGQPNNLPPPPASYFVYMPATIK
jgi:hypothetical protein